MVDLLLPFVAGQRDTADAHNNSFDLRRTKYQSADQSVTNSTALVLSTSLVLSVKASVSYIFEAQLFFDANTTADFKMNLLLPSLSTVRLADVGDASSTSTQRVYQGVAAGTIVSANPSGYVEINNTAGNLTIQFAQNTASTTATILKAKSWIRLTQISL